MSNIKLPTDPTISDQVMNFVLCVYLFSDINDIVELRKFMMQEFGCTAAEANKFLQSWKERNLKIADHLKMWFTLNKSS